MLEPLPFASGSSSAPFAVAGRGADEDDGRVRRKSFADESESGSSE